MDYDGRCVRVRELDAQWQELETRKIELQNLWQDLESQQRVLDAERVTLGGPSLSLPDDVLIPIMKELYLHDFPFCNNAGNIGPLSSPITMTHVSRRLRHVALSLPCIWKCIHVTRNHPSGHLQIHQLYLDRSAPYNLNVTVVELSYVSGALPVSFILADPDVHLVACVHLLCSHAHRWRQLALLSKSTKLYGIMNSSLVAFGHQSLPHITFLSLYMLSFRGRDGTLLLVLPMEPQLSYFPKLTHLHTFNFDPPLQSQLLGNMTELSLCWQHIPRTGLAMLALAAPKLASLALTRINNIGFGMHDTITYDTASCPALRYLLLSALNIERAMVAIKAPRLRFLVCQAIGTFPFPGPRGLTILLNDPSFPRLKNLQFYIRGVGDVGLFFKTIPTVISLDLICYSAEILDSMTDTAHTSDPILFPELRELKIAESYDEESTLVCSEVLVKFLTMEKGDRSPFEQSYHRIACAGLFDCV